MKENQLNNGAAENRLLLQEALALLPHQIERFTMGSSSSLPRETAEELLNSLCFVIDHYRKNSITTEHCKGSALLSAAEEKIREELSAVSRLLTKIGATPPPLTTQAYDDTLKGFSLFVKVYDYRFFAHEMPLTIDYPLAFSIPDDILGIDYGKAYLTAILWENYFCRFFQKAAVLQLAEAAEEAFYDSYQNIFSLCATNALGRACLSLDINELLLSSTECHRSTKSMLPLSTEQRKRVLNRGALLLIDKYNLRDTPLSVLLRRWATALLPRINTALTQEDLSGIFVTKKDEEHNETGVSYFTDNPPLANKALVEVMTEITNQSTAADKIAVTKRNIHSIEDLLEVLSLCFWGEETLLFLNTLDNTTREILGQEVKKRRHQSDSHWEKYL